MKRHFATIFLISTTALAVSSCGIMDFSSCHQTVEGDCIYYDSSFESKMNDIKVNSPPVSTPTPIYWETSNPNLFPQAVNFDYVYIKKPDGLWLRYAKNPNVDFYLGEKIPDGFIYRETHQDAGRPKHTKAHSQYNISLSNMQNQLVYQQELHFVTWYYKGFDLTSLEIYPSRHPIKSIYELQSKVTEFPIDKNDNAHFWYQQDQHNLSISGNRTCPPIQDGKFAWQTSNQAYKVEFNPKKKGTFWSICGNDYHMVIEQLDESHSVGCDDDGGKELQIQLIQPSHLEPRDFHLPAFFVLDHVRLEDNHFKLKAGYNLEDIVAYRFNNRLFTRNDPRLDNMVKEWRYEVLLYDKNGNVVNEFCDGQSRWIPTDQTIPPIPK